MKKILFIVALLFTLVELNAHGACLIENLKIKSTCTGGASKIEPEEKIQPADETDKKELQKYYQPPTMSYPDIYKNNFPMLNQNCMFGTCFPK